MYIILSETNEGKYNPYVWRGFKIKLIVTKCDLLENYMLGSNSVESFNMTQVVHILCRCIDGAKSVVIACKRTLSLLPG